MFAADRCVITRLGEALDLAEQFPADAVGVVVDTYHVWWDAALLPDIARAGDRIFSYQVCDWILPLPADTLLGRGHVGDGHIDFPPDHRRRRGGRLHRPHRGRDLQPDHLGRTRRRNRRHPHQTLSPDLLTTTQRLKILISNGPWRLSFAHFSDTSGHPYDVLSWMGLRESLVMHSSPMSVRIPPTRTACRAPLRQQVSPSGETSLISSRVTTGEGTSGTRSPMAPPYLSPASPAPA